MYGPINFPNLLSLLRVCFIPLVIALALQQQTIACMVILIISLLTDFLDGWLARKLNQSTAFGALLDPIADKIVILAFTLFIFRESNLLPMIYLLVVNIRNISQLMAIPILSWWLKVPFMVKPKLFAKIGTTLGFIVIVIGVFLIAQGTSWPVPLPLEQFIQLTIFISLFFESVILVTYIKRLIAIATRKHDTFE